MNQISFLHTSDWQIGMSRWFLDEDAQARFDDARLKAISRLGAVAVEHGCTFIVVAGDVFDANALHPRTLGRALEALGGLPVPVYLLPGNHDPLTADSIFHRTADMPGVHVITDSTPISVAEGVEIVGAPLASKHAHHDLVGEALDALQPYDGIRIMVGHGQVASRGDSNPALIDIARVEQALADGRISYLALGDTHSAMSLSSTGRVWFSGSPEATDYREVATGGGEANSGKALVVELGTDCQVTEVPIGTWRFDALTAELNSAKDVQHFLDTLRSYPDKDTAVIKYALSGSLDVASMAALETGISQLQPVFGALYERERLMKLTLDPDQEDLDNLEVSGYARAALEELLASTDPAANDALRLMFRLVKEN